MVENVNSVITQFVNNRVDRFFCRNILNLTSLRSANIENVEFEQHSMKILKSYFLFSFST